MGDHFQAGQSPIHGCSKSITTSHLLPLSQAGSCTPSRGPLPPYLLPGTRACPQHTGSQGCPPLVPVFHIPESSSEGGAHEGFPSGVPRGREGCKEQALCWANGLGKCASPNVPFASLSSFPLPFPQSLVSAASVRRAHALSLLLPWCSLPRVPRLQERGSPWSLVGAWKGHHVPGRQRWGRRENAEALGAALWRVPELPCLPTGMGSHWEAEGMEV